LTPTFIPEVLGNRSAFSNADVTDLFDENGQFNLLEISERGCRPDVCAPSERVVAGGRAPLGEYPCYQVMRVTEKGRILMSPWGFCVSILAACLVVSAKLGIDMNSIFEGSLPGTWSLGS
jgi:hypothetical protein